MRTESQPWACVLFFLSVCVSLCIGLRGDIGLLSNMYSISFLLVMAFFSVGGIVMKYARPLLPRPFKYSQLWFAAALVTTTNAFLGALLRNAEVFATFVVFFVVALSFVMLTYYRVFILSSLLRFLTTTPVLTRFSGCYDALVGLVHSCLLRSTRATPTSQAEEEREPGKNHVVQKNAQLAVEVVSELQQEVPPGAVSFISPTTGEEVGGYTVDLKEVDEQQEGRSSSSFSPARSKSRRSWSAVVQEELQRIREQGVVFFCKDADLAQLNKVLQYIFQNEDTGVVRIVHCTDTGHIPRHLPEYVALLNCIYPEAKIDLCVVNYAFVPSVIPYLGKKLNIPANCMFITCPTANFKHRLATLGGVRVILNDENVERRRESKAAREGGDGYQAVPLQPM